MVVFDDVHFTRNDKGFFVFFLTLSHSIAVLGLRFVIDFSYPHGYNYFMIVLQQTKTFSRWLSSLKDRSGRIRILSRLDRIVMGNFSDVKSVGKGISEIRIDTGPGYRLYFIQQKNTVILLLCGGDKSTQARDIARAQELLKTLE